MHVVPILVVLHPWGRKLALRYARPSELVNVLEVLSLVRRRRFIKRKVRGMKIEVRPVPVMAVFMQERLKVNARVNFLIDVRPKAVQLSSTDVLGICMILMGRTIRIFAVRILTLRLLAGNNSEWILPNLPNLL
mmetsp:Transcript_30308/g.51028  ORF Transcript_30308/g.51028 Transcript_30308/m.51028 type:complete len:134 (+) Transcript_30308:658-1059(+)